MVHPPVKYEDPIVRLPYIIAKEIGHNPRLSSCPDRPYCLSLPYRPLGIPKEKAKAQSFPLEDAVTLAVAPLPSGRVEVDIRCRGVELPQGKSS